MCVDKVGVWRFSMRCTLCVGAQTCSFYMGAHAYRSTFPSGKRTLRVYVLFRKQMNAVCTCMCVRVSVWHHTHAHNVQLTKPYRWTFDQKMFTTNCGRWEVPGATWLVTHPLPALLLPSPLTIICWSGMVGSSVKLLEISALPVMLAMPMVTYLFMKSDVL